MEYDPQQPEPEAELETASERPSDGAPSAIDPDTRTLIIIMHLLPLAGFMFPWGGSVIAPLILWLIKKPGNPEIDRHGKEVVNFQITILIAIFASTVLVFLVIGIPLLIGIGIFNLVMIIMGAMEASEGKLKRYPMNLNLIK